jgi:hypothetical protein
VTIAIGARKPRGPVKALIKAYNRSLQIVVGTYKTALIRYLEIEV